MKARKLLELCEGKKLLRHNRQVFFLTKDRAEADRWQRIGARLIPFEPRHWTAPGTYSYEVHLTPLLDKPAVALLTASGEREAWPERDTLFELLRKRDGDALDLDRE